MNRIFASERTPTRQPMLQWLTRSAQARHWLLAAAFLVFLFGNMPLKKPLYALLLLAYFALSVVNLQAIRKIATSSVSMLLLWGLLLASYFWSVVPSASANAILSQSIFLAFALSIAAYHQSTGFGEALRSAAMALIGFIALYCLLFPSASLSTSGLRAFFIHKNLLGAMMALCAMALFHAPTRSKVHVGFGVLAVALLIASQSKTSIVLFLLCHLLLLPANWWSKHFYKTSPQLMLSEVVSAILWATVLLGLVLLVVFSDELFDMMWAALPKTALTGRGTLWLVVLQQIRGDTLLGIGPGTFWQAGGASEINQTTLFLKDPYWVQNMISADGGYIDLIASFGFVGLALFLLTATDLYRRLFKCWHRPDSRLVFVLTTFVIFHAITESTVLYSTNILWLIYLVCYFYIAGNVSPRVVNQPYNATTIAK